MLKRLALAALALTLTAETPPPATLAPYIKDGRFDPGDYGWLRGNFSDATPAQRAEWQALKAWLRQCHVARKIRIAEALARHDVTLSTDDVGSDEGACGDFAHASSIDHGDSWPTFQSAVIHARPVAQTIIWGAALAQVAGGARTPEDAAMLMAAPITDQVLRQALSWNNGEVKGAPSLDPIARGVANGLIWIAIADRDHANTAWLKALVARGGWPTIAKVGKDASHMAWLLVQHADDDPLFQLDMLRLMEPLAARGEVTKKDYAFLYDRVMLKLAGKQRYGSQWTCAGGRNVPRPLEDAKAVDPLRHGMGMDTLADNAALIEKMYGPCPPDVIPPSPAKR